MRGVGWGRGILKLVDYQNWNVLTFYSLGLNTKPSQQTLTRDRMVVPTGNHLFDSIVCCPGGKP